MLANLKENLNKRICDCEEGAVNTDTYKEYIVWGWEYINCPMTPEEIAKLDEMSNEELNKVLEEIDYLVDK